MVRVRFDGADGRRETTLLSGKDGPDLATALRAWVEAGGPAQLPRELTEAEFLPGEGGGCLCDEEASGGA